MVKKSRLLGAVSACVFAFTITSPAHAALLGRDLDGNLATAEAYYDDVTDLTWLADANAALGSVYDINGTGAMTWYETSTWAAGLNFNGVTNWRLPTTPQVDATCDYQSGSVSYSTNCTGSEMGNMFYNVLGGDANSPIATTHNDNYGLFTNIHSDYLFYWSATDYAPVESSAFSFSFENGETGPNYKGGGRLAWAVHDGSVGAAVIPIPASVWLFGSGLLGLVGIARRKWINKNTIHSPNGS